MEDEAAASRSQVWVELLFYFQAAAAALAAVSTGILALTRKDAPSGRQAGYVAAFAGLCLLGFIYFFLARRVFSKKRYLDLAYVLEGIVIGYGLSDILRPNTVLSQFTKVLALAVPIAVIVLLLRVDNTHSP